MRHVVRDLRGYVALALAIAAQRLLDLSAWVNGDHDDFRVTADDLHRFEAWQAAHRRDATKEVGRG